MEVLGQAGSGDEGLKRSGGSVDARGSSSSFSLAVGGEHDAFWLIRQIRERCPST